MRILYITRNCVMPFNPHEYKVFRTEHILSGSGLKSGGAVGHFATLYTGLAKLNKPLQRFDDEMSNVKWGCFCSEGSHTVDYM